MATETVNMLRKTREVYPPEIRARAVEIMRGTNHTSGQIIAKLHKEFKREVSPSAIYYWRTKAGLKELPKEAPYLNEKEQEAKACMLAKKLNQMWRAIK